MNSSSGIGFGIWKNGLVLRGLATTYPEKFESGYSHRQHLENRSFSIVDGPLGINFGTKLQHAIARSSRRSYLRDFMKINFSTGYP